MQPDQKRDNLSAYHLAAKFRTSEAFVGQVFECGPQHLISRTGGLKSGSIFRRRAQLCQVVKQTMNPVISAEEQRRFKAYNLAAQRLVPFPGVNLARRDEDQAAASDGVASSVAHEGAAA
jgi:hypothetical protein